MSIDVRRGATRPVLPPDRSLHARMAVTLALVVLLPFAFVYALQFLLNTVGYWLLGWFGLRPQTPLVLDPVVVGLVVLGVLVVQYRYGPQVIANAVQATDPDDEHRAVTDTVTRLATQANLPTPTVRVFESRLPNAFAVGTPRSGTVVVSTGLLDLLDESERTAVLAHELSHLKNRDASLMTVAWLLPTVTLWLVRGTARLLEAVITGPRVAAGARGEYVDRYGFTYNYAAGHPSASGVHGGRSGPGMLFALVVFGVGGTALIAVAGLFWAGSVLVFRVLSRYREFAADRAAATLTGSPAALASALAKLDDGVAAVPDTDLRGVGGGVEALYIAPLANDDSDSNGSGIESVFPDAHPPTAERIERLRAMVGAGW